MKNPRIGEKKKIYKNKKNISRIYTVLHNLYVKYLKHIYV